MALVRLCGFALVMLMLGGPAQADPTVSFDADPGTPGIQSLTVVAPNSGAFDVEVAITGVEESAPLNAFEFDLGFDPSVLSPVAVVDGGFLLDPFIVVELVLGTLSVDFAEATIGPEGTFGDGVLATITFEPVGLGESLIDLNDVILTAPFGEEIANGGIEDGAVTVPEPAATLLACASLVVLTILRSAKNH